MKQWLCLTAVLGALSLTPRTSSAALSYEIETVIKSLPLGGTLNLSTGKLSTAPYAKPPGLGDSTGGLSLDDHLLPPHLRGLKPTGSILINSSIGSLIAPQTSLPSSVVAFTRSVPFRLRLTSYGEPFPSVVQLGPIVSNVDPHDTIWAIFHPAAGSLAVPTWRIDIVPEPRGYAILAIGMTLLSALPHRQR